MDKQELPINNPAERLYVILTRAAESARESSIEYVLCTAMDLETNAENFVTGFSELMVLLEKVEEQTQYFSSLKQKGYLALTKNIRNNLFKVIKFNYLNTGGNNKYSWKNVGDLSNPDWPTLHFFSTCVADFEECGISLSEDRLNDLINNVEDWMQEIREFQLDEEIKKLFIHKLMEIKHLLEKYYYHGSSRIKTEIYATMMEIGIYQENLPEDKKDKNKNLFQMFYDRLSKLSTSINPLMTTAVNADKLLPVFSQTAELVVDKVKHFLPPGI